MHGEKNWASIVKRPKHSFIERIHNHILLPANESINDDNSGAEYTLIL